MKKLSELQKGDRFIFIPDQMIWYLPIQNRPHGNEYQTNGYTEFLVLQKNEKSVKARPVEGRVEYFFKFKGPINNDTVSCVDCDVILTE